MLSRNDILFAIKESVLSIEPDAEVMLFGSRARGDWHQESDWDILVLTEHKVTYQLKKQMYDAVYLVTEKIYFFINVVVANKDDWAEHPGWYSLSASIKNDLIAL